MNLSKLLIAFLALLSAQCAFAMRKPANHELLPPAGFYNNADGSPILGLINGAENNIAIEIYEVDDPTVIAAIRSAAKRGVRVQIVKEPAPVGKSCHVFETSKDDPGESESAASCADQQQLVKDVQAGGGAYVPFNKSAFCKNGKGCLEHGKIVIVDNRVAMISTGNFNTTNLCDLPAAPPSCNRDYSYVTQDAELVSRLSRIFSADLKGDTYDLSAILSGAEQSITVSPLSLDPLVNFIRSAKHSIAVENQYLNEPNINQALMDAASRGIAVSVTVSSVCSFGKPSASEIRKTTSIYSAFDAAGISSRMFTKNNLVNGTPGYMHAKTIIVDGTHAWLGSVNGSTQAATANREFGIFFDQGSEVQKLATIMAADHDASASESWQDSLNCAERN
jgi:phosphatidylserine/phosphatidylglycerophosphate/cardiolipin synthase-like enzyme